jgi:hypothetical protein
MTRQNKKTQVASKRTERIQQAMDFYAEKKGEYEEALRQEKSTDEPSIRSVARRFNISYSALQRRISGGLSAEARPGKPPHFNKSEEEQLLSWIFEMSNRGFAISRRRTIEMAQGMIDVKTKRLRKPRIHITHQWWNHFKKRHPNLVKRRTDELQRVRGDALVAKRIKHFFQTYVKVIEEKNIPPEKIYNCDEVGIIIDAPPKETFTKRGTKRTYVRTSGNRVLISMMGCVSAIGNFVPPAFVFPGKKLTKQTIKDAPAGTVAMCTQNGYFTSKAFLSYLEHFARNTNLSSSNPVLLILDGFLGPLDLASLEYAKSKNIEILCFPSHATHAMQPMDVGVFSPFKSYYRHEYSVWMEKNPNQQLTKETFSSLISDPFYKAFVPKNIVKAFESTGLYPVDQEKILAKCRDWKISEVKEDSSDSENDLEQVVETDLQYYDDDDDDDNNEQVTDFEKDQSLLLLAEVASQESSTVTDFSQILTVPSMEKRIDTKRKRKKAIGATEHFLTHDSVIEKLKKDKESKRRKLEEKERAKQTKLEKKKSGK